MLSQNGFTAIESYGDPRLIPNPTVPGTGVKVLGGLLAGDVATVLLEVGRRWHTEVEPLEQDQGIWGYSYRPISGSGTLSNHSSGTAVDYNATLHPLGVAGTFTAGQRDALRRIRDDLAGVVRFGEFYSGRVDGMHAEIDVSTTDPRLARVAARIRSGAGGTSPTTGGTLMALTDAQQEQLYTAAVGTFEALKARNAAGEYLGYGYPQATHNAVGTVISMLAGLKAGAVDVPALADLLRRSLAPEIAAELARRLAS